MHLIGQGFRVRVDPVDDPDADVAAIAPEGGGYRSGGGEAALLEDLARLESPGPAPARRAGAGDRGMRGATPTSARRDARMPAVAVIVDPSAAAVDGLVALRSSVEPAIAFAAESVPHAHVVHLEDADWRVIRVRRPADLPAAWQEAWRTAREAARTGGRGGA
ncbi:hypothetical protein GCM10025870_31940 [Agromyces marinus]|uniref:Uncharacterized protein n=1 Tax=Agromyces marinus TaxID=1389020 RepID=A0ABN6YG91_9MICO|nr:hypothetical protein [Agromyces marinus]BDZ56121.1 hypothetical protein GCM10025870_31940 [Agromyces marinus]